MMSLRKETEDPGVSSKVQAVGDTSGPVDFTDATGLVGGRDGKDPDALVQLLGVSSHDNPTLWKNASPITFVRAGLPPFYIMHGDHDQAVPYTQSEKFYAALKAAGVPVEFVTVKGGRHMYDSVEGGPAPTPDKGGREAAVLAFFDKYLKQ